MNEKILKLLQGDELHYPHALEKQYLRIFNKIIELWYTPKAEEYFLDLMVDKRGNRQGFPPKVAAEIFHLSQVHERTCGVKQLILGNPWSNTSERDLQSRDFALVDGWDRKDTSQDFFKAIECSDIESVKRFLSQDANLTARDERGWPPLMIAASNGQEEITLLLLQNRADVRAKDNAGYTPLHWAAFNGHTEVAKLLLMYQANPDALSNFGWTPLMQAATRGHLNTARQLIESGANVNIASKDGWTALHKTTSNGHIEVVKLLLDHHANRDMKLQDNSTPLAIATKNKNEALIALLNEGR
jgi:ankyrin repeat protein